MQIVYSTTQNVPMYCNGSRWIAMGDLNPSAGGAGCATATMGTKPEGYIFYNLNSHVLQYCDGDNWRGVGVGNVGCVDDSAPDAFGFIDQNDVSLTTLVTSNIVQIVGVTGDPTVSISGDGSPEFRTCVNSDCSTTIQNWTTGNGTIQSGNFLQLRLTSNAAFGTLDSATVAVGTASDQWDVTTLAQDATPDAFSFTDQTNVALNTLTTSNTVTIGGITGSVSVSVSGDGAPQVRIDGGSWVTSGSITDGQTLEVRLTSNAAFSTMNSATVTVGTASDQWDVTTVAQDTTPDAFSFTDQTNVALNTVTTSNSVTISGITGSVSVSVSGAGTPQIRIDGGSWVTSGSIANGESLEVRLTSANADSTMRSAAVTVGSGSDQWDVTTNDNAPNAFSFTDQTNVALNTLTTSNSVTINGITGTVDVAVSGAGGPEVRVNGGSWTAGPTTITSGQTLEVRLTSANADLTMRSATVTVGSGSDQWDVTTGGNVLLVHADGADGSTAFTDSSANAHTITANGNAQADTAQSKFGGASFLSDGTSDYLSLDGNADFTFGTADFTIDFWVRLNAKTDYQIFYDGRPSSTNGVYPSIFYDFAADKFAYYVSSANRITGTTTPSTGTWYHIAVVRSGTSSKMFVNGNQEGATYTDSNNYLAGGAGRPFIGAHSATVGAYALKGWMDEVRVSKGIARWTSNFTPPSSPY